MNPATWKILVGDCREVLQQLPAQSVHAVVTSPPFFGLRDYGTGVWGGGEPDCDHRRLAYPAERETPGGRGGSMPMSEHPYRETCGRCGATREDKQIGLEPTPDEFADALVVVFREIRRVLRDDGVAWLNLGDSYNTPQAGNRTPSGFSQNGSRLSGSSTQETVKHGRGLVGACKPKDLIGIPWMVAFALRADGWYLRSEVIWSKPNPMPESITDRPTKAHEQVFLLAKSGDSLFWTHRDGRAIRVRPAPDYVWINPETLEERTTVMPKPWKRRNLWRGHDYYYDDEAIREADTGQDHAHRNILDGQPSLEPSNGLRSTHGGLRTIEGRNGAGRNKRSVWTVATHPYAGAHFATFPPQLIEPCILAGAPERACAACGAPWIRVTEGGDGTYLQRAALGYDQSSNMRPGEFGGHHNGTHPPGVSHDLTPARRRTVGFEASCSCSADAVPGVVLDPFAGAGTTILESLRLNRSAIGVELSPEYAAMARDRIVDDAPLLNSIAELEPAPEPEPESNPDPRMTLL